MHKRECGQSTLELAVLIAVVVLCFIALSNYIKYAAAARLKSSADSLSQTLFNPTAGKSEFSVTRKTTDTSNTDGSTTSGSVVDLTTRTDTL